MAIYVDKKSVRKHLAHLFPPQPLVKDDGVERLAILRCGVAIVPEEAGNGICLRLGEKVVSLGTAVAVEVEAAAEEVEDLAPQGLHVLPSHIVEEVGEVGIAGHRLRLGIAGTASIFEVLFQERRGQDSPCCGDVVGHHGAIHLVQARVLQWALIAETRLISTGEIFVIHSSLNINIGLTICNQIDIKVAARRKARTMLAPGRCTVAST